MTTTTTDARAAFRAYMDSGQNREDPGFACASPALRPAQRHGRYLKTCRRITEDIGVVVMTQTLQRWMKEDYPEVAKAMAQEASQRAWKTLKRR